MRGRKPKPTALKRIAGNPGKRKLHDEPVLPPDLPDCPAHLTKSAKAEWARVSVLLHAAGVIKTTDRAALAAYCQAYGDWADARVWLAKVTPKQMATEDGFARYKAFVRASNTAVDQMRRWAVELGLTPSARARIKAEPPEKERSLAELLFGTEVQNEAKSE